MATDIPEQPLFFGASCDLSGHWHRALDVSRGVGVVVCGTVGREDLSAYPTLRRVAVELASVGFDVLRFDYPACGDSTGEFEDADLVPRWVESIGLARDELRRLTGVTRFVHVGLRLGALLAMQAAIGRDDVMALVAIAPVISGRLFVREARMLDAAAGSAAPSSAPATPPANELKPGPEPALEFGGYLLSAATCEQLRGLDAMKHGAPVAPRMLVIERDDLASQQKWFSHLHAIGASVDRLVLPGYAQMMLDPEYSRIPQGMVDAQRDWLSTLFAVADRPTEPVAPLPSWRAQASLADGGSEQLLRLELAGTVMEATLHLPPRTASFSSPGQHESPLSSPAQHDRVMLMPSPGATRRSGPGRLYTRLARHLASQGWVVLRADLSGLGDSPTRANRADNTVYGEQAADEVVALANWLRQRMAASRCVSLGLCSGAYHSLKAAASPGVLDAVVAINPLTFYWHDGDDMSVPDFKVVGELNRYRDTRWELARWLKLLRGEVDLRRLGGFITRRAIGAAVDRARDLARVLRVPLREDLARDFALLLSRGVRIEFVVASDDPAEDLLAHQGGAKVKRWLREGTIGLATVDGADHTFTREVDKRRLLATLNTVLPRTIGKV